MPKAISAVTSRRACIDVTKKNKQQSLPLSGAQLCFMQHGLSSRPVVHPLATTAPLPEIPTCRKESGFENKTISFRADAKGSQE